MQSWLTSLYSAPSALVKINDIMSDAFTICNGMRQGCPLQPIIFILALEPFLRTIRAHLDIRGISTKGGEHKLAAYANDLIFFITSPLTSIPSLLSELCTQGSLSDFKVNYSKSEAMGVELNMSFQHQIATQFNFKWTDYHIRYLGTNITNKLTRMFEFNLPRWHDSLNLTFNAGIGRFVHGSIGSI